MDVRIVICGLGKVGRAFVGLLLQKDKDLKERYGFSLKVVAAWTSGERLYPLRVCPCRIFWFTWRRGGGSKI